MATPPKEYRPIVLQILGQGPTQLKTFWIPLLANPLKPSNPSSVSVSAEMPKTNHPRPGRPVKTTTTSSSSMIRHAALGRSTGTNITNGNGGVSAANAIISYPQTSSTGTSTAQPQASPVTDKARTIDVNESQMFYRTFIDLWMTRDSHPHDVTIQCRDGEVKADKWMLNLRSLEFKEYFAANPSSTTFSATGFGVQVMTWVLEFIYIGRIFPVHTNYDQIFELIRASNHFKLSQLHSICVNQLAKNPDDTDIGELVKFAYTDRNILPNQFKRSIQNYVLSRRLELAKLPEFQAVKESYPQAVDEIIWGDFTPT